MPYFTSFPMIAPLIIWGIYAGVAGLFGIGTYSLFKKEKNKLGILGMPGAGKTRFLCHLRGKHYSEKQTEKEQYEPFTYTKRDGKKIAIDKGEDIGGTDQYIDEYERIINESDVIFYFLNIYKYLYGNNIDYVRYCNMRLELVHSCSQIKDNNINNVILVGSHLDKCNESREKVLKEFYKKVEKKQYYPMLKNIYLIDITKEENIKSFVDKIFYKKL